MPQVCVRAKQPSCSALDAPKPYGLGICLPQRIGRSRPKIVAKAAVLEHIGEGCESTSGMGYPDHRAHGNKICQCAVCFPPKSYNWPVGRSHVKLAQEESASTMTQGLKRGSVRALRVFALSEIRPKDRAIKVQLLD